MKRIILLFLGLSLWTGLLRGQSDIVVFPKIVEQEVAVDLSNFEKEIVLRSKIINKAAHPISIRWEQDFMDQPFEWQADVSDKYYYYFLYDDERLKVEDVPPIDLKPGESFDLTLYVYPRGRANSASYFFNIIDARDSVIARIPYYIEVKDRKERMKHSSNVIKIFPNPAEGFFELAPNDNIKQINLYNALGSKTISYEYEPSKKYDVSKIPNGLYSIEFLDEYGHIITTVRIIVNNPRA